MNQYKDFYDQAFAETEYAEWGAACKHPRYQDLANFVKRHRLESRCCLEVGCGRGLFQDIARNYVGTDLSDSVSEFLHKPFIQCSATSLPFENESFDAVWSINVLEHVAEPELALNEIRRVLRPNGLLFLSPAWHTRSWVADGYPVRPYGDLNLKGKLIKLTIPVVDSRLIRYPRLLVRRLCKKLVYLLSERPYELKYQRLSGNFEHYWMSDSDAVCSLDPFDFIEWFTSRGDQVLSCRRFLDRLVFRRHVIEIRVKPIGTVAK